MTVDGLDCLIFVTPDGERRRNALEEEKRKNKKHSSNKPRSLLVIIRPKVTFDGIIIRQLQAYEERLCN